MSMFNYDWFLIELSNYVSVIDMAHIKFINWDCHKAVQYWMIELCMSNVVQHKLSYILGKDYDTFMDFIKNNNMYISGSFALQCILDETWEHSDIDIYHRHDGTLYGPTYKLCHETYIDMIGIWNDDLFAVYNNEDYKRVIQIIQIQSKHENNLINIIKRTFDFDICKNAIYFDKNKLRVYIYNLENISNKKFVYTVGKLGRNECERISKYQTRGFDIKLMIGDKINDVPVVVADDILFENNDVKFKSEKILMTIFGHNWNFYKHVFENNLTVKFKPMHTNVLEGDNFGKLVKLMGLNIKYVCVKIEVKYVKIKHSVYSKHKYDIVVILIKKNDEDYLSYHNSLPMNYDYKEFINILEKCVHD